MNLHTSRISFEKDSSYICWFYTKLHAPSKLVSEIWQNICSNQNIETSCKSKLKLTKRKELCLNSTDNSQRNINLRKQQFKNFEISAEETSFQIMSFCFQFCMYLLLTLRSITQNVTKQMMQNVLRASIMIAASIYA